MAEEWVGRYRILNRIASGAQATVYRVTDTDTGRLAALKVLERDMARDPGHRARLEREARLAASLDHPNIVRILEVGEDGDIPFIAMELLPDSLDSRIDTHGALPEEMAVGFAIGIASGLEAAHERGIIHRDIKPQNVLIAADGTARLSDFGIARALDLTALTRTGARMGTPHYMSPEQADGKPADERSDIYSLGCVMYHMLSGTVPFSGDSAMVVMRMHLDSFAEPLARRRLGINHALAGVVERCMARRPEDRFQTAGEVVGALKRLADVHERPVASGTDPGPMQTFRIGDAVAEHEAALTGADLHLLQPEEPDTPTRGHACATCGALTTSDGRHCDRCAAPPRTATARSAWERGSGTLSGTATLGFRRDPAGVQGWRSRLLVLSLMLALVTGALAGMLLWTEHQGTRRAASAFSEVGPGAADLDVGPIVKRFVTGTLTGETRVEMRPDETQLTGVRAVEFRSRFGRVESALVLHPEPEAPAEAPPGRVYRTVAMEVFTSPEVNPERIVVVFDVPRSWLDEQGVDPEDVVVWQHRSSSWNRLLTRLIATSGDTVTYAGFAPSLSTFAVGAP